MDGVIATGLAKEPGYRYRTTRDLAAAARAALATAPPQPFVARAPISTWNFSLVLVRLGRRILLVHERKHGQLWYLPAGRVEPGETFATAARRETLEEAGIDVVLEGVLRIEHTPLPVNARMRVVFVGRHADDRAAKSIPDDESLGAAWFTLDEIAGLPLRSEEVRKLARQVLDGPFIHPMSLFASE
jgi:phosphatase NudJ